MDNEDFDKQEQHIVYLRLITGDEIIGECIGELEDSHPQTIILKSPMVMSEMVNPYTQSLSITLSKYMVFGCEVMPIRMDHIVSMTSPMKELEDFYNTSIVFNREIADKEIIEELERATESTKMTINTERKNADFEEKIDQIETEGKNIVLPSNTNIH